MHGTLRSHFARPTVGIHVYDRLLFHCILHDLVENCAFSIYEDCSCIFIGLVYFMIREDNALLQTVKYAYVNYA